MRFLFSIPVPDFTAHLEIPADSVEHAQEIAAQVHPEAVFVGIAAN